MRRLYYALAIVTVIGSISAQADVLTISRSEYQEQLEGFWLGQCIANWTGIVTEMDKIGVGEGDQAVFYTREDWGGEDQPSFFGFRRPDLSRTIDWVRRAPNEIWGADDDTDIEYMYQHLLSKNKTTRLTGEQIREGWLTHIYDENNSPLKGAGGRGENFLWVSNQRAHDLMLEGVVPPATSDPDNNKFYEMIDAQLTTELFGLFAPGRPDIGLQMAALPIRTTASGEAALASEFYVVMHALAATADPTSSKKAQIQSMAAQARSTLPDASTTAKMYDFVKRRYEAGVPWEQARDEVYQRYQVEQQDGYDMTSRNIFCNGCFASGINFAASIVSLLYGEGDYQETVKIAVLAGWDSDNRPQRGAACWVSWSANRELNRRLARNSRIDTTFTVPGPGSGAQRRRQLRGHGGDGTGNRRPRRHRRGGGRGPQRRMGDSAGCAIGRRRGHMNTSKALLHGGGCAGLWCAGRWPAFPRGTAARMRASRPRTVALALCILAMGACSPKDADQDRSDNAKPTAALVMKSLANEFFVTMAAAAEDHQQQHHDRYELVVNGIKNESDLAQQVALVDQMIGLGVDAIVIAPADSKALVPALARAPNGGVHVVNIDNRLDADVLAEFDLAVPFIGPDNRKGAREVALFALEQYPEGASVAVLEGVTSAHNAIERRTGFEEAIAASGANLVSMQSAAWDQTKAAAVTGGILVRHPEVLFRVPWPG